MGLFLATTSLQAQTSSPASLPSRQWHGFDRLDFTVDGRSCILVRPHQPAPGNSWIWRTEFFGNQPQADIALLGKGFCVAYIDVKNMYGAPVVMGHMDAFYQYLTQHFRLSDKTVLEGFSRGGLFAFNWAARNPHRVAGIYVDAPVCDFKSWPGGKRDGATRTDWQRLKQAYGFKTDQEALDYKLNPIDNLKPLADAHIPILSVCGGADTTVPIEQNTRIVEKRYKELGGEIQVIVKPGGEHHPHSLKDPTPIVDFVTKAVSSSAR